jgi:hypothetical protein
MEICTFNLQKYAKEKETNLANPILIVQMVNLGGH